MDADKKERGFVCNAPFRGFCRLFLFLFHLRESASICGSTFPNVDALISPMLGIPNDVNLAIHRGSLSPRIRRGELKANCSTN
jgi:hypothetical protein